MKNLSLFSVVAAILLVVVASSCTTVQRGYGDGYEDNQPAAHRIYVDDPYQGTIVLERDPLTGRYYQVSPYRSGYSSRYDSYRYNDRYYDRYYDRYPRYEYPRYPRTPQQPPMTEQQKLEREKSKQEARKKVLGG